ncbi:hypothetical protein IWX91DRAFT_39015 [Phyllosticta citricarpa]
MGRHTMVPTHPNMIFLFYNIFFASIFSFFSAVVLPIGMTIRTRSQRRPSRQGDKEIRKPGNQETKIETKRKATPHPHLFLLARPFSPSPFISQSLFFLFFVIFSSFRLFFEIFLFGEQWGDRTTDQTNQSVNQSTIFALRHFAVVSCRVGGPCHMPVPCQQQ